MDLNNIPIFGLMNRRMSWLTQRHVVLAQNIANADSPSYAPKDLSKASFLRMLRDGGGPQVRMAATSANHLPPIHQSDDVRAEKERDVYEAAPAGNAVVLEEQLMKVSETQSAYRLATNLYRKHVAMFKAALGRE